MGQVSSCCGPTLPYYCTVVYHKGKDQWYGQIWDQEEGQQKVQLVTSHIVIGPEGVAMAVDMNTFVRKWYEVPNACPHIRVLIKGFKSKHIGPMMKRASEVKWVKTESTLLWHSPDGQMMQILYGLSVMGQAQNIQISVEEIRILTQIGESRLDTMRDKMIVQVST